MTIQTLPLPFMIYILAVQGIIGAVLASFLTCMAYRQVNGESVLRGRSHCDSCSHTLGATELIPIFGYLITGGRCRRCGERISPLCPISEAVCAVLFALFTYLLGLTPQLLLTLSFLCVLMLCVAADIYARIVPDGYLIAAMAMRLLYFLIFEGFGWGALLRLAVDGLSVSLPLLILVLMMEKLRGKELMGGGDIKLLFVTGLYLGWQKNLFMLLLACTAGIIAALVSNGRKGGSAAIPFAPCIGMGSVLSMLVGDMAINAYLELFF